MPARLQEHYTAKVREALIKADEETWVVPKEVAAALDGNPREKFTSVEAMLAAIGR